jgi:organic hydroperoxide reductase OsmC/OhrA
MAAEESTTTVVLRRRAGYAFDAHLTGRDLPDLLVDEPPPLGGGKGPDASQLLAGAIGSCLASSLLFCLGKAGVEVGEFPITVSYRKERNAAGRLRIGQVRVTLAPGLRTGNPARFDRCLALFQDYCTVTASVREGIAVDVAVEVAPPPDAVA